MAPSSSAISWYILLLIIIKYRIIITHHTTHTHTHTQTQDINNYLINKQKCQRRRPILFVIL